MQFETLSESLNIDIEVLKELNPMYKKGLIPVGKNQTKLLKLPRQKMGLFIANEEQIYAISKEKQKPYIEEDEPIIHRVKERENIWEKLPRNTTPQSAV